MVILSFTTSAATVVSGHIFSDVYSRSLKSRASLIGGYLASQMDRLLAPGIPLDELVGFEDQCREIVEKHKIISYAMVVNREGKILFHNDPSQHGNTLSSAKQKAIQNINESVLVFSEGPEKY